MTDSTPNRVPARSVRIWLVEDNPGDVYLIEKALQAIPLRYEIVRHEDGEQAIRALAQPDWMVPDLVLLDLNLPRLEGFDVLHAIRSRPALVGVPVGILTTSDSARDRNRVALLGAERYIRKPATFEAFVTEVGVAVTELLAG